MIKSYIYYITLSRCWGLSDFDMDGEERSTCELILSGNDEKTLSLIDL